MTEKVEDKTPIVIDSDKNQELNAKSLNKIYSGGIAKCEELMDKTLESIDVVLDSAEEGSDMLDKIRESIFAIQCVTSQTFQLKKAYCNLNLLPNSATELENIVASRKLTKIKEIEAGSGPQNPGPNKKSIADR